MERQTRMTKQRAVILHQLREVKSHPTADEIYAMTREKLPRISLGTVYRNLELLCRQGEIQCLDSGGHQKRFDGNCRPHHHVRCLECGKIGDAAAEVALPDLGTVQTDGFDLTGVEVMFQGICDNCRN